MLMEKEIGRLLAAIWSLEKRWRRCVSRELAEETGVVPLSQKQGPWTNDIMETKHYVTL